MSLLSGEEKHPADKAPLHRAGPMATDRARCPPRCRCRCLPPPPGRAAGEPASPCRRRPPRPKWYSRAPPPPPPTAPGGSCRRASARWGAVAASGACAEGRMAAARLRAVVVGAAAGRAGPGAPGRPARAACRPGQSRSREGPARHRGQRRG